MRSARHLLASDLNFIEQAQRPNWQHLLRNAFACLKLCPISTLRDGNISGPTNLLQADVRDPQPCGNLLHWFRPDQVIKFLSRESMVHARPLSGRGRWSLHMMPTSWRIQRERSLVFGPNPGAHGNRDIAACARTLLAMCQLSAKSVFENGQRETNATS